MPSFYSSSKRWSWSRLTFTQLAISSSFIPDKMVCEKNNWLIKKIHVLPPCSPLLDANLQTILNILKSCPAVYPNLHHSCSQKRQEFNGVVNSKLFYNANSGTTTGDDDEDMKTLVGKTTSWNNWARFNAEMMAVIHNMFTLQPLGTKPSWLYKSRTAGQKCKWRAAILSSPCCWRSFG